MKKERQTQACNTSNASLWNEGKKSFTWTFVTLIIKKKNIFVFPNALSKASNMQWSNTARVRRLLDKHKYLTWQLTANADTVVSTYKAGAHGGYSRYRV